MAAGRGSCMHTSRKTGDDDYGDDDDDDDDDVIETKHLIITLPSTGQRNDPVRPRRKNKRKIRNKK